MTDVDFEAAARRWAHTWQRAWPGRDSEAILDLYAPGAVYRALAFRDPDTGRDGVFRYLDKMFKLETEIECWFGEPVVSGDRAAVEWWASWVEEGERLTMAGTSNLQFDASGLVVDQRDYWNETPGRVPPYDGWQRS